MQTKEVIAIDGPAGAGKSTVAKAVAKQLGFLFLDTGAMYRCVALLATRAGLGPNDGEAAARLAQQARIEFRPGDPQVVMLNGENVTQEIRQPPIGDLASQLSVHSAVRQVLVRSQQEMCSVGRVVMEGRDTTTVVCPEARLKIFMTASEDERARRRWLELKQRGVDADLEELKHQIRERDHRDSTRPDSPLRVSEDAVVLDTDGMSIDQVVERVLAEWSARQT